MSNETYSFKPEDVGIIAYNVTSDGFELSEGAILYPCGGETSQQRKDRTTLLRPAPAGNHGDNSILLIPMEG